jgi:antitoxin YefM
MEPITATEARADLYRLIDRANQSHEPVLITGKRGNAVLVAEEDWRAIEETLHLSSVPGLVEDIKRGLTTPVEECSRELRW